LIEVEFAHGDQSLELDHGTKRSSLDFALLNDEGVRQDLLKGLKIGAGITAHIYKTTTSPLLLLDGFSG
jgi:hypothetical protein